LYKYGQGRGGLFVEIDHGIHGGKRVKSRYMHLDTFIVTAGQTVTAGQQIGTLGDSGNPPPVNQSHMTPHLHFEIKEDDNKVDPVAYLFSFLGVPQPPPKSASTKKVTTTTTKVTAKAEQIGGGDRSSKGRLALYFNVKDTQATLRARDGQTSGEAENTVDKDPLQYPMDAERAWPAKAKRSAQTEQQAITLQDDDEGANA